jgi:hypothetical protein
MLLRRIQSGNRQEEQGVDEMIQLRIANAILDHPVTWFEKIFGPSPSLVLATGDGNNRGLDPNSTLSRSLGFRNYFH